MENLYFDDIVSTSDEQELRRAWDRGDFDAVTKLALERYGPEILGVAVARLRSVPDADDAFSMFSIDLMRGIPGFQWRCSLRAWAHRIARNAATRWATARERSPDRNVPMEQAGVLELAERIRSTTQAHLRTEVKSKIRRLREELPPLDQELLMLRVNNKMKWAEIAAALADRDLSDEELHREEGRLRKRFEHIIKTLRDLARERGLLED